MIFWIDNKFFNHSISDHLKKSHKVSGGKQFSRISGGVGELTLDSTWSCTIVLTLLDLQMPTTIITATKQKQEDKEEVKNEEISKKMGFKKHNIFLLYLNFEEAVRLSHQYIS